MKIVLVSDLFDIGGAAIACERWAAALGGIGVPVVRISSNGTNNPNLIASCPRISLSKTVRYSFFDRAFGKISPHWKQLRLANMWTEELLRNLHRIRATHVIFHNIHHSPWTHDSVIRVSHEFPTVWFAHDLWPAYPYAFEYPVGERKKQTLPDAEGYPLSRFRKTFPKKSNLLVWMAPSRWACDSIRRAMSPFGHGFFVLPNPIPLDLYRPMPKSEMKNTLGLPTDRPLILLSTGDLKDERKGIKRLLTALDRFQNNFRILMLGAGEMPTRVPTIPLGEVKNPEHLVQIYQSADALICPSRIDNSPNVIAEALACGTSVIATDVGGIPEILSDSDLISSKSDLDFDKSIERRLHILLESYSSDRSFDHDARARAEVLYHPVRQSERLVDYLRKAFPS